MACQKYEKTLLAPQSRLGPVYLAPNARRYIANRILRVHSIAICSSISVLVGCAQNQSLEPSTSICSPQWLSLVEEKIGTADGQGHGPDIGSQEWRSVIEFHLGVRGNRQLPSRNSEGWCVYIDQLVF